MFPPEFDFESLRDADREADRPSPLVLQALQEVGQRMGLDADKIIAGAAIEFEGVTFWLSHHGQRDPNAMVLFIREGSIPAEVESLVLRTLLEHNAFTPAAVSGYYSLLPGTNTAAYCMRVDLERNPRPSDSILAHLGFFALQMQDFAKASQSVEQMIAQAHADAASSRPQEQ